jgi:quercetin dioxygenase-like cupin family protein
MSAHKVNLRADPLRQMQHRQNRAGVLRLPSAWARRAALVLIGVFCLLAAGAAPTGGKKPAPPARIDAKALTTMLQHFDKVEQVKYPWGWIRWLMNSQLDPQSEMTLGIVEINAGQANPLHVHPNCEELIYVLSGSCEHRIGGQTVVLKAGDVLRIPRGVLHAARTSEQGPVRALVAYSSGERQMVAVEQ